MERLTPEQIRILSRARHRQDVAVLLEEQRIRAYLNRERREPEVSSQVPPAEEVCHPVMPSPGEFPAAQALRGGFVVARATTG